MNFVSNGLNLVRLLLPICDSRHATMAFLTISVQTYVSKIYNIVFFRFVHASFQSSLNCRNRIDEDRFQTIFIFLQRNNLIFLLFVSKVFTRCLIFICFEYNVYFILYDTILYDTFQTIMRSSLLVFLLLFRRVVSRINNGSTLFHAKVIKDQILIIPFDRRIQLCTICHASGFHYFKYVRSRTDIIYKAKQKIDRSIKGNFIYSTNNLSSLFSFSVSRNFCTTKLQHLYIFFKLFVVLHLSVKILFFFQFL